MNQKHSQDFKIDSKINPSRNNFSSSRILSFIILLEENLLKSSKYKKFIFITLEKN